MQKSFRVLALSLMAQANAQVPVLSECGLAQDKALCKTPIKGCTDVTVIEDTASGWKDGCMGLTWDNNTLAECEASCKANVNCSVWQWSGVGESSGPHCYQGVPREGCRTRPDFVANAGQRLQHGAVAIVKPALGLEVMNLMSFAMDEVNAAGAKIDASRCRQACYTDATCSVWQYGMKSGALGCWIENGVDNQQTTIDTDVKNNEFAAAVTDGEFIVHFCPVPPPVEESNTWIWLGPLLGVLTLAAIGLTIFLLQPKKKIKKTRAIKLAPAKEEVVPLWIPMPTVVVPQQQVVYQTVQQPQYVVQEPQYVQQVQTYAAPVSQPLLSSGSVIVR
jgi:hypothetical protein